MDGVGSEADQGVMLLQLGHSKHNQVASKLGYIQYYILLLVIIYPHLAINVVHNLAALS